MKKKSEIESKAANVIIGDPFYKGDAFERYNADLAEDNETVYHNLRASTRLIEIPSRSCVCLFQQDNGVLSFDVDGEDILDIINPLDFKTIRKIQDATVSLNYIKVEQTFKKPDNWRDINTLRNNHILLFKHDGKCISKPTLSLDKDLGVFDNTENFGDI